MLAMAGKLLEAGAGVVENVKPVLAPACHMEAASTYNSMRQENFFGRTLCIQYLASSTDLCCSLEPCSQACNSRFRRYR